MLGRFPEFHYILSLVICARVQLCRPMTRSVIKDIFLLLKVTVNFVWLTAILCLPILKFYSRLPPLRPLILLAFFGGV